MRESSPRVESRLERADSSSSGLTGPGSLAACRNSRRLAANYFRAFAQDCSRVARRSWRCLRSLATVSFRYDALTALTSAVTYSPPVPCDLIRRTCEGQSGLPGSTFRLDSRYDTTLAGSSP